MESSLSVTYISKTTHHFKFNYAHIKYMKYGGFVSSPAFHALGHGWVIDCYPFGLSKNPRICSGTYFLVRVQGECNINVDPVVSLSLVMRDGTLFTPLEARNKEGTVGFQYRVPYYCSFITQFKDEFVKNCSFELICSIGNTDKPPMSVPESFGLLSQIRNILECQETADVTFDVGARSFMCHKAILAARSPVLKAELFGSMAEAQQNVIKIKDMSPEVFEATLHFMYTDSFPSCDSEKTLTKMAQHLFQASDRYAIDGLKSLCEDHLCASVSLDTVAATLILSEQHNSLRLRSSCLEFLGEPGTLISWMLTDEYADFVRSFPSIMTEIRAKVDTIPFVRNIKKRET